MSVLKLVLVQNLVPESWLGSGWEIQFLGVASSWFFMGSGARSEICICIITFISFNIYTPYKSQDEGSFED